MSAGSRITTQALSAFMKAAPVLTDRICDEFTDKAYFEFQCPYFKILEEPPIQLDTSDGNEEYEEEEEEEEEEQEEPTPQRLVRYYTEPHPHHSRLINVFGVCSSSRSGRVFRATLVLAENHSIVPAAVADGAPGIHSQRLSEICQRGPIRMGPVVYNAGSAGTWESAITIRAKMGQVGCWRFAAAGATKNAACHEAARRSIQLLRNEAEITIDANPICVWGFRALPHTTTQVCLDVIQIQPATTLQDVGKVHIEKGQCPN